MKNFYWSATSLEEDKGLCAAKKQEMRQARFTSSHLLLSGDRGFWL
jgi:hypothetical protein